MSAGVGVDVGVGDAEDALVVVLRLGMVRRVGGCVITRITYYDACRTTYRTHERSTDTIAHHVHAACMHCTICARSLTRIGIGDSCACGCCCDCVCVCSISLLGSSVS